MDEYFLYDINVKVTLQWREQSNNKVTALTREQAQIHIDHLTHEWISNQKNKQNLMNMILGNNGILI